MVSGFTLDRFGEADLSITLICSRTDRTFIPGFRSSTFSGAHQPFVPGKHGIPKITHCYNIGSFLLLLGRYSRLEHNARRGAEGREVLASYLARALYKVFSLSCPEAWSRIFLS